MYNDAQNMLIDTINYESEVVSGQLFSLASQRLSNSDTMQWASERQMVGCAKTGRAKSTMKEVRVDCE